MKKKLLALVMALTVAVMGGGFTSNAQELAAKAETEAEVTAELDVKVAVTDDNKAAVFITNKSRTVIDWLEVQMEYLDENGQVIDLSQDIQELVLPEHMVVSSLEIPKVEFADARIQYMAHLDGMCSLEVNHLDEVEIACNAGNNCVIVQAKNNSAETIDYMKYIVALYKGDKLVSLCHPGYISSLASGQSATQKIYAYSELTYDNYIYGTDYDRIEVYLNQAYSYGI